MESEAELKGGRGENQGMIASGSKKGNATMRLVSGKQVSNEERETKKKKQGEQIEQIRGAERKTR